MPRLPRIPDLLTTANLSCGVGSILLASQGQLTWACWLVFAGAAFDVLDGLAARAFGGGSEFGKQLDSLADMVTFGVAPGMLIMGWFMPLHSDVFAPGVALWMTASTSQVLRSWCVYSSVVIIPLASAWRLAKFNVDARQAQGFLGLATPANALFWCSISLIVQSMTDEQVLWGQGPGSSAIRAAILEPLKDFPLVLPITAIALAVLMLSELPLPSLKFKHFGWKGNEVIYILIAIGAVLIALYGVLAVPLILIIYLLSPLWGKLFPKTI